jgi:hypothetical protein
MPAALVERGEYALHLGLSVARDRQPGALPMMLVEVCRAVRDADVWQASAPRLEAHESLVPLKIGDVLGAAARLDVLPARPGVVARGRLGTILAVRLLWTVANFGHAPVLPVGEAQESQSLSEMGRKERLVLSAGRLTWWIRASWFIGGIMVHLINHEAPFNHELFNAQPNFSCRRERIDIGLRK